MNQIKSKIKRSGTCCGTAYTSQMHGQKHFTISEVADDSPSWADAPTVHYAAIPCPSLHPKCSTNQPHQAFSPQPISYDSFPIPLRIRSWEDLSTEYSTCLHTFSSCNSICNLTTNLMLMENHLWWDSNCGLKHTDESDTLTTRPLAPTSSSTDKQVPF